MGNTKKDDKNIEILRVNEELIKLEKHNGFNIKNGKLLMFIKKLPANIYKLVVLVLATIAEKIPEFISKLPVLGYAVDFVKGMGENYLEQMASDEFFDNVLCPFFGIKVDPIPMNNFANPEYTRAFAEFTHHEGNMFGLSLLIKSVATFAMEHPALVVAGGLAIAGVAIKAITAIVKGIAYKVKYKKLNENQKEIFALIKDILKDSRRIKKGENGKLLLRDLNITYKIVDYLGKYTTLLSDIKDILIQLQTAVELKDTLQYEKCRLALETIVFDFDKKHDNMLEEDLDLIENNKSAKEVDMNISK